MPSLAEDLSRSSVLPPGAGSTVPAQFSEPLRKAYPQPEASTYYPTVSEKLGDAVRSGMTSAGFTPQAAQHFGERTTDAAGYVPGLGTAVAAGDTTRDLALGDYPGAAISAAGLIIPGASKAKGAIKKGAKAVEQAVASTGEHLADAIPGIGHNAPPTGKLNPLANEAVTFRGKQPGEMTPEEYQAFGQHYGVPDLGPLSPVQTLTDASGRQFQVPGGTEGKWTYYDLLHMKANPINPAQMDRELHQQMQLKLGRTHTPENLTDADVWNGLVFGMTSPNNPLFPNQMAASRLRLRDPQMLDDLASMIPWKPGETPTPQARKLVNDNIAARFGLQAAPKGGLGVRGTADYSRVGEMAQLFKQDPSFFRKQPNEDWGQAVERISSQLPGLSMKTGSFGTVWQDPANAAISAIDRHMARELELRGGLFETPEARTAWENRGVNLWNNRIDKETVDNAKKGLPPSAREKATSWSDLLSKQGSDGFVGEMLLSHVGAAGEPKFRLKSGEINPDLPTHLAQATWVREPDSVFKMGQAYKRALQLNQQIADENGLNLFMSQWMEWDRIRNRFEPHENMFPGLKNMPAMSTDQLQGVDAAHRATGHKTYTKDDEAKLPPTRTFKGLPSKMGYLGLGGAMVPMISGKQDDTAN
jgi:hypothetical protein